MPKEAVLDCAHRGQCYNDVVYWAKRMKRQLAKIDCGDLRRELREYGAWKKNKLANHNENLIRIVWLAACDIKEFHHLR
jgi:hypothetical protein